MIISLESEKYFIHSLSKLFIFAYYVLGTIPGDGKNPCLCEQINEIHITADGVTCYGEKLCKQEHCGIPKSFVFYKRLSVKASLRRWHLRRPERGQRSCPRDIWRYKNSGRRHRQCSAIDLGRWVPVLFEELCVWSRVKK